MKNTTDRYDEGIDANANGLPKSACPYPVNTSERVQWIRGWIDFQPIREQWEQDNHERAKRYA